MWKFNRIILLQLEQNNNNKNRIRKWRAQSDHQYHHPSSLTDLATDYTAAAPPVPSRPSFHTSCHHWLDPSTMWSPYTLNPPNPTIHAILYFYIFIIINWGRWRGLVIHNSWWTHKRVGERKTWRVSGEEPHHHSPTNLSAAETSRCSL